MTLITFFANHAYQYRPEKPFILSSGATSPEYLDCRTALSDPTVLMHIAKELSKQIDPTVDAIGGLTMGADPLAVGISLQSPWDCHKPLRWFSVRKQAKAHGQGKLIEGSVVEGEKVCVLEDVVTSGASTIKAIKACTEFGLDVVQVLAVVDRQQGGMEAICAELGHDKAKALFTLDEVRRASRLQ